MSDLEPLVTRAVADARFAPSSGRAIVVLETLEGEAWHLAIAGDVAEVIEAVTPIDATLRAHRLDWIDLLEGVASVKAALIDGRLELEGDVAVASRVCRALFG